MTDFYVCQAHRGTDGTAQQGAEKMKTGYGGEEKHALLQ